jgi:FimV-like protein
VAPPKHAASTSHFGTWLLVPVAAPDFELPDPSGRVHALRNFRGGSVLLSFWTTQDAESQQLLRIFQEGHSRWARHGVQLVTVNVDGSKQIDGIKALLREKEYSFLTLLANDDVAAIYNILYRYLFDRRRDLRIPTSFLLDADGSIVKVYQGLLEAEDLLASLVSMPRTSEECLNKGLPFSGRFYGGAVHRNTFTYGVAYYERGYFDQAMASFQETLRNNPDYPEAHYNLGSLYLQKQMRMEAKGHFQKALQLRPDYPDALNNSGLIAAEEGESDEAAHYFQEAIRRRPNNATALLNLGNLYRQNRRLEEAEQVLEKAFEFEPNDPEVNYSLGMLFAQKDDTERAREYLRKAVKLRPGYPEALNNLGVLYLRTGQSAEAVAALKECIRVAASFDQAYLNLARAYVAAGERQKAQEILRELLDRQPEHPTARKMLEQLAR